MTSAETHSTSSFGNPHLPLRLAVIGLGKRAMGMLETLRQVEPSIRLTAVVDPNYAEIPAQLAKANIPAEGMEVLANVEEVISRRDDLDGVLVGTRCHMHAPMAVALAQTNLPLYLEKPVAISQEQLQTLAEAYRGREHRVVVSFPLRMTPLFQEALAIVRSGRLGVINQIQAVNDVSYGGVYYHTWYRNFEQTGGLWLQKATHDVDYLNLLANSTPVTVAAMISRQAYDDPSAVEVLTKMADQEGRKGADNAPVAHQDAGAALFMYANGLHVTYSQNFISRSAGRRGAVITGHAATLSFDWYTNLIHVSDHLRHRVDQIEIKSPTNGHGGGDQILAQQFISLMRGKPTPGPKLHDGILSAAMCLAAREAANTHQYQPIIVPGKERPATWARAREETMAIF